MRATTEETLTALEGPVASSYAPNMTKVGGVIGAVLAIAIVMFVGDRIDWTADQSDFVGNAVFAATGVIGWLVGSRIVRRLRAR